jgi:hypothetical protein
MYLISKHKDYYDTALGFGIDASIVYKRDEVVMELPIAETILKGLPSRGEYEYTSYRRSDASYNAIPFVIGFCGKMYLGYTVSVSVWERSGSKIYTRICWSVDDIEQFLIDYKLEESLIKFNEPAKKSKSFWYTPFRKFLVLDAQAELNKNQTLLDIFVNYKTPIFKLGSAGELISFIKYALIVNPVLRKVEFYRVVDAYTAFQEISHYISGVLTVPPDNHHVSDKTMLIKRGFDDMSFKTLSPGKKFNRRK